MIETTVRQKLVDAARGLTPLDLLLCNARLLDMATGEIRLVDIGIVGEYIACVLPCDTEQAGLAHKATSGRNAKHVEDIGGAYVTPGLIDTHVHLESSHFVPAVYSSIVVPMGTTTVLWDPHELANVCGLSGVRAALETSRGLPLRVVLAAPSCVPAAPGLECAGAEFKGHELAEMLAWPEVCSVGELMNMRGVLEHLEPMNAILAAGHTSGKLLDGHARNLSGTDLQAYVAAGINTDHELVSAADAVEKLRAGLTLQIRGSHDYLLPDIAAELLRLPHLGVNVTLCTDDIPPDLLLSRGGLIYNVRRLVAAGLPATDVLRMATFNAANLLGLRDRGLVAPGRLADLVLFRDLAELAIEGVYAGGKKASQALPATVPGTAALPRGPLPISAMSADDFTLRIKGMQAGEKGRVRLRTIKTPRFTQWSEMILPVTGGLVNVPDGQARIAVRHRHARHAAPVQLALLEDWGQFTGAIASTYTHDSHNLVVIGGNPEDMAAAANRLAILGGGMVVVKNGEVLAEVAMPVAGIMSDAEPQAFAQAFARVRERSAEVAEWQPPLRVFKAIEGVCLACNAGPHLTDLGLTDGTTRKIVDMVMEIWRE